MEKKLQISHFWVDHERAPVDSFIRKFEKKFRSIGVETQPMEWGMYFPTLWAKLTEGNPPDVSITEIGQRLAMFVDGGHLIDLTDLWQEQGYHRVFPEEVKKGCTVGGKMYGVPSKEFTFAVWYLKDVFKEKGLHPPKTWDRFLKLCEELKEEGMYPIVSSGWGTSLWFVHVLTGLSGPEFYTDLVEGNESWTDPEVVKAYQWLKKLVDEYFYPDPYAYSFPTAWMKLNEREAAMQLQGDWVSGMWQRAYNYSAGDDYDCFILPPINPRTGHTMVVGGNAWVAFGRTRDREKAIKFLEYAGSREAHELLAKKGMGILSRKDVPSKVYDKVLKKLRNRLSKSRRVPEFGVYLPQEFINFEGKRRLRMLLSPTITAQKIRELLNEVEEYKNTLKSPTKPDVGAPRETQG